MRFLLAYDGTSFRGWAAQRDHALRTVEGELVGILSLVTGEEPSLSVAGRTDAGVHARGQVVSFPTSSSVEPERLLAAVNAELGPEVVVREAKPAPFRSRAGAAPHARAGNYYCPKAQTRPDRPDALPEM